MSRLDRGGDTLAKIAARGAATSDVIADEGEVVPVLPDIRLPGPEEGDAFAFEPRPPFGAAELAAALIQERTRMAPFLRDLSPALPEVRTVIVLDEAEWRLEPADQTQTVALPHYGGPMGRARAWYTMQVTLTEDELRAGSLWVCFGGVDYRAAVFFNGKLVGTHEGFFSPFEFEVKSFARVGENALLVRVDNDAVCMGNHAWGDARNGDKIYAATGLGWDEPGLGWHHCPPGMGIHRPVRVETRPTVHLHDLFVRPLLDEEAAEIWIEVFNCGESPRAVSLNLVVCGQNFVGDPITLRLELPEADAGLNRFRVRVPLSGALRWSPETPWLYRVQAILNSGEYRDALSSPFGMRSFVLDESPGPDGRRGRFFLNGEMIRLRGANTMGHEQQCVFRGDLDQLRDDILLAKLAHMNFLRFTQRPVEPEVYDLCDRLGLMAQTDLPLFGYLRRNQFCEAIRQASEMERLIRRHPANVLVSLINEPFPAAWGDMSHRHLTRGELENFFVAAAAAIRVENPDRQIKPIDGDYEPPGPGLPDGHCYAGWYNGHGIDLGKLHCGHWLEAKPGWNYACGEFGAEGLDYEDLMRSRYPAEWLPKNAADECDWSPSRIHRAQTGSHFYLWIEPGTSMAEWIQRSQAHQEWITRLMTEAFRRNNHMVSFAIHLFIDAWPAGWMKTIMDCRRHPKPAYFAYREALTPLAVSLRIDRTTYFAGQRLEAEVWVCNDRNAPMPEIALAYQFEHEGEVVLSGRAPARIRAGEAVFQGRVAFDVPAVVRRQTGLLRLGLMSAHETTLHDTQVAIEVLPESPPQTISGIVFGQGRAAQLAAEVGLVPGRELLFVDNRDSLESHREEIEEAVRGGATAILLELPAGQYAFAGSTVRVEEAGMEPRHFVARAPGQLLASAFEENDFRFWHDTALDGPSPLLHTLFFANSGWEPILTTGQGGWGRSWEPALAVAQKAFGKGRFVVCQLRLAGRLNNPVARLFFEGLATGVISDTARRR